MGVFTAITSTLAPIRIHELDDAILTSTGPFLAQLRAGRLDPIARAEMIRAPGAGGTEVEPPHPAAIQKLVGRWPHGVWGILDLGLHAQPAPGAPSGIMMPVPKYATVQWDAALGRFVEQPGLAWVSAWPGGVLACDAEGKLRWVDGADRPVPPVLTEGVLGSVWTPPDFLFRTASGDVLANIAQSPRHAPGWWVFPGGSSAGEKLAWPPDVDERTLSIAEGPGPRVLLVSGNLKSGAPFCALRAEGRWDWIPPLPADVVAGPVKHLPSGKVVMVARDASFDTRFLQLHGAQGWGPLPLRFPEPRDAYDSFELVLGPDDDVWLSLGHGSRGPAVLYHARL